MFKTVSISLLSLLLLGGLCQQTLAQNNATGSSQKTERREHHTAWSHDPLPVLITHPTEANSEAYNRALEEAVKRCEPLFQRTYRPKPHQRQLRSWFRLNSGSEEEQEDPEEETNEDPASEFRYRVRPPVETTPEVERLGIEFWPRPESDPPRVTMVLENDATVAPLPDNHGSNVVWIEEAITTIGNRMRRRLRFDHRVPLFLLNGSPKPSSVSEDEMEEYHTRMGKIFFSEAKKHIRGQARSEWRNFTEEIYYKPLIHALILDSSRRRDRSPIDTPHRNSQPWAASESPALQDFVEAVAQVLSEGVPGEWDIEASLSLGRCQAAIVWQPLAQEEIPEKYQDLIEFELSHEQDFLEGEGRDRFTFRSHCSRSESEEFFLFLKKDLNGRDPELRFGLAFICNF